MKNPESIDPVYLDLLAQEKSFADQIKAEEKTLLEHENALKAVEPQTGQIKYAQKRVEDSRNRLARLNQQRLYYELSAKKRLREARKSYRAAFNSGQSWPDPKEFQDYKLLREAQKARETSWSIEKRLEELQINSNPGSSVPRGTH